jgi:hypothetical protein
VDEIKAASDSLQSTLMTIKFARPFRLTKSSGAKNARTPEIAFLEKISSEITCL